MYHFGGVSVAFWCKTGCCKTKMGSAAKAKCHQNMAKCTEMQQNVVKHTISFSFKMFLSHAHFWNYYYL